MCSNGFFSVLEAPWTWTTSLFWPVLVWKQVSAASCCHQTCWYQSLALTANGLHFPSAMSLPSVLIPVCPGGPFIWCIHICSLFHPELSLWHSIVLALSSLLLRHSQHTGAVIHRVALCVWTSVASVSHCGQFTFPTRSTVYVNRFAVSLHRHVASLHFSCAVSSHEWRLHKRWILPSLLWCERYSRCLGNRWRASTYIQPSDRWMSPNVPSVDSKTKYRLTLGIDCNENELTLPVLWRDKTFTMHAGLCRTLLCAHAK